MSKLRAGVIGVGYLGNFHAQKYAALEDIELVGVADANIERAKEIASELSTKAFADYSDLISQVDLVSIVVPTDLHHSIARDCLNSDVHILLEKPVTITVAEAEELIDLAKKKNRVFQVGHLERFNPAIMALDGKMNNPMYVESHRLAPFKIRGTDVNVVMDLMIHDIDIILNLVQSEIKSVSAVGVPVLSGDVDIANARLEFVNGCVANVTASRVSREGMRKLRIFQPDAYFSIDYNDREITMASKKNDEVDDQGIPVISVEKENFEQADALMSEIKAFIDSIKTGKPPVVSGEDGKRALEVALTINKDIQITNDASQVMAMSQ
ncbi:MAG: Gfo/Idh/MocA family oxidoreductase [Gammaproteobacteria bacterium]|nr:Gfo/Idh/MocA family oxidoreductase [Gammaproteobacteria bacterium]